MFNKRVGRVFLLVLFVFAVIASSVFFYQKSEGFTQVPATVNEIPQWMKDSFGTSPVEEAELGAAEAAEDKEKAEEKAEKVDPVKEKVD